MWLLISLSCLTRSDCMNKHLKPGSHWQKEQGTQFDWLFYQIIYLLFCLLHFWKDKSNFLKRHASGDTYTTVHKLPTQYTACGLVKFNIVNWLADILTLITWNDINEYIISSWMFAFPSFTVQLQLVGTDFSLRHSVIANDALNYPRLLKLIKNCWYMLEGFC